MVEIKNSPVLYVLTHCESCYNRRGIFTGRTDSVLTSEGHRYAKVLADKLKNKKIDVVYRSSLIRTAETLEHIIKYHPKAMVVVDDRIIERDYGDLVGKSKQKYEREHPDLYPIYHRSYNVAPPGGESMVQVEKRVLSFVKDVSKMMKKEKLNVLVIAHSNSIRPIRKYFEGLSSEEMMKLDNLRHKIFKYRVE